MGDEDGINWNRNWDLPKGKGIPLQIEHLRNIGISVHICCTFMYFHIYTLTIQKTCCKTWAQSWLKLWSLDRLNQWYFLPITQTQKHVQKSYWIIWKIFFMLNTQTIKNHQNPQCELTPLVSVALLPHRLGRCGWRPEDRWNRPSWPPGYEAETMS